MKQSKILKIVAIFIIGMLVFCNIVMAENEVVTDNTTVENTTNESTNTTPQEPVKNEENDNTEEKTPVVNNNSSSQTSKPVQTTAKSDNADLTNLGIRPNDFSGFTPNKLTYDVTVPLDVESIEVYATASDSKASISGTGKKNLKEGLNEFEIVVTAEDGTVKTYTINVTREESATEETGTEESIGEGLASLKIADLELTPEFETNVYEYTAKYDGDDSKIDVKAVTTDPKYVVDITGNSDLKDGENIITILESDGEENNVATYQVTVSKNVVDENKLQKEQEDAKKQEEQRKLVMIGAIVVAVILAIIIYLIIRHKRNNAWAEDYMMPYSSDRPDDGFVEDDNQENSDVDNEDINNDESVKEDFQMSKQEARKMFLSGYDHKEENYESNYERPRVKRHRSKGKRFK